MVKIQRNIRMDCQDKCIECRYRRPLPFELIKQNRKENERNLKQTSELVNNAPKKKCAVFQRDCYLF